MFFFLTHLQNATVDAQRIHHGLKIRHQQKRRNLQIDARIKPCIRPARQRGFFANCSFSEITATV